MVANGQKSWVFAVIASVVSVLVTSFTWLMLTAGMRSNIALNENNITKLENNQVLVTDLKADIAVLKSNMGDVRNSVRVIEQSLTSMQRRQE